MTGRATSRTVWGVELETSTHIVCDGETLLNTNARADVIEKPWFKAEDTRELFQSWIDRLVLDESGFCIILFNNFIFNILNCFENNIMIT